MSRTSHYDFVDPLIMKIVSESNCPMTTLAINYRVNQSVGKTINLKIIKDHLTFLVSSQKISKSVDSESDIVHYSISK